MATSRSLDPQTQRNLVVDASVAAGALIAGISGIYFLFLPSGGYQGGSNAAYGITVLVSRTTWHTLHDWGGLLMIVAAVVHLALHWRWFVVMLQRARLSGTGRVRISNRSKMNLVLNVIVAISFGLVALSGIYFLFASGGGYQGGRNVAWDPMLLLSRTTWDLIHTWSGATLVAAGAAHIAIHWRWILKVTRRAAASIGAPSRTEPVPATIRPKA